MSAESANAYIPIDRRRALVDGVPLPERTRGAALFGDISGFTPLTEALERELGPKRGAEELTVHLNRVYDGLIAAVHRFGGSVIGFAGDAVTCWFDGDDGRRATACALAMQRAMGTFAAVETRGGRTVSLGMKAAVTVGSVRRFLVGTPEYVVVDAMAGKTLENLAAAEQQAQRGDVILGAAAAANLAPWLAISAWRSDAETGARFAVVTRLDLDVPETPWPSYSDDQFTRAQRAAWVLPPIHQRLESGQGMFLAELRPAAALFLRFGGINYDTDEDAPAQLEQFIAGVAQILMQLEGSLIQLTIGDKGSYLYAAFGAPIAHENDAIRAGAAAVEMQTLAESLPFLEPLQIGVTLGRMRTGAYGAATRRTYGVLGDNVNLAARLMSAAQPGQILVSDAAREAMGEAFVWDKLDDIQVKGKREPVALSRLVRLRRQRRARLLEPRYALPMVGRAAELALIDARIDRVLAGVGQIVGITAEAGMGKSRLAAEVIGRAQARGLTGFTGECNSYGSATSYLVWQGVWRAMLDLDPGDSVEQQIAAAAAALRDWDPALAPRLPLLQNVLNLPIPDNDLTASLDARTRKSALESLLLAALEAQALRQPLLIVLEDIHWMDPLSNDLMLELGRALATLPVLLLLVYRPPDRERAQTPAVAQLPHFSEVALQDFTPEEAEQLIGFKLQQFFGAERRVSAGFVAAIAEKAEGNPFYIEEILNYLKDLGVDPDDSAALARVDLPTSIYSLILSRIDQLTQRQQVTMRVASVIGRLFPLSMLWGVHPELGEMEEVQRDLQHLSTLDLTPLDSADPEQTYLFKHVLTQEIAYESLLYSTRAVLHDQIGQYIERTYAGDLDRYLALLAFHFEQSENEPKKRIYLRRAGEAAQAAYANTVALNYYDKLRRLLPPEAQAEIWFRMGQVHDTTGRWVDAEVAFRAAAALAEAHDQQPLHIRSQLEIGDLYRKQSNYEEALAWFAAAQTDAARAGDQAGVGRALHYTATVNGTQGDLPGARASYEAALVIRRALDDQRNVAKGLINLGAVARSLGDYEAAVAYQQEAIAILRERRDRWPLATALNNLGNAMLDQGDATAARRHLEEAVAIQREIGHRWFLGNALNNLANVAREQGDVDTAQAHYAESMAIYRQLNDRWALAYLLEDSAALAAQTGAAFRALRLAGTAARLREEISAPLSAVEARKLDARLGPARTALGAAAADHERAGRRLPLADALDEAVQ